MERISHLHASSPSSNSATKPAIWDSKRSTSSAVTKSIASTVLPCRRVSAAARFGTRLGLYGRSARSSSSPSPTKNVDHPNSGHQRAAVTRALSLNPPLVYRARARRAGTRIRSPFGNEAEKGGAKWYCPRPVGSNRFVALIAIWYRLFQTPRMYTHNIDPSVTTFISPLSPPRFLVLCDSTTDTHAITKSCVSSNDYYMGENLRLGQNRGMWLQ